MNMLPLVLHLVWSKKIWKHIVLHKNLTLTVTHSWRVLVSHFWTAFGWQLVFRQGTATSTLSTRSYLDDVIVKVEFCWCNLVQDVLCSPTMLMPLKLITCHFTEIITVWMRSDLWWLPLQRVHIFWHWSRSYVLKCLGELFDHIVLFCILALTRFLPHCIGSSQGLCSGGWGRIHNGQAPELCETSFEVDQ